MKITKAMGRACLDQLTRNYGWLTWPLAVRRSVCELGWTLSYAPEGSDPYFDADDCFDHEQTALAMCAAIAGVKPE